MTITTFSTPIHLSPQMLKYKTKPSLSLPKRRPLNIRTEQNNYISKKQTHNKVSFKHIRFTTPSTWPQNTNTRIKKPSRYPRQDVKSPVLSRPRGMMQHGQLMLGNGLLVSKMVMEVVVVLKTGTGVVQVVRVGKIRSIMTILEEVSDGFGERELWVPVTMA